MAPRLEVGVNRLEEQGSGNKLVSNKLSIGYASRGRARS